MRRKSFNDYINTGFMKRLYILVLILIAAFAFKKPKTIRVEVSKNLELFGLMMQLDMGADLTAATDSVTIENKKNTWRDWYLLSWKNYQRYKQFDSCATMKLYRDKIAKGLYNDFFVGFLEQVDEVPHAKVNSNTDTANILPFSSKGELA